MAFAGIGIPLNFYKTLTNNGIKIVKLLEYPDHHMYSHDDIKKILYTAKRLDAKIITTEKDYAKLIKTFPERNIYYLQMELKIKNADGLISLLKGKI